MPQQQKINLAVLFGGASSEHEVSRMSVTSILSHLDREKYQIFCIGIKKDRSWWLYQGTDSAILNGDWERDSGNRRCTLSCDPAQPGILAENGQIYPIDAALPVLHGKNGEDGTVQGMFELHGIPYVGCGVLASAVCMDKGVTNTLLQSAGIPEADFIWFYAEDYLDTPGRYLRECAEKLGFPVFVKPANAGSSVGVSKARNEEELKAAIQTAAKEDGKIVIEAAVDGIEVECAVLGNSRPIASCVGEIVPPDGFYGYDSKYINNTSSLYIPARIPEETARKVREQAVKAFRLLGCSGLARVDFFVRRSDGEVLLNELNTLPGFTSISMYPKLFAHEGIPYSELLDRLIQLALEKWGAGR